MYVYIYIYIHTDININMIYDEIVFLVVHSTGSTFVGATATFGGADVHFSLELPCIYIITCIHGQVTHPIRFQHAFDVRLSLFVFADACGAIMVFGFAVCRVLALGALHLQPDH